MEYEHLIRNVKEEVLETCEPKSQSEILFSEILCSHMSPSKTQKMAGQDIVIPGVASDGKSSGLVADKRYSIGGLVWKLQEGRKMEDYLLFWIGPDNSAFANVVLTFNGCEIGI